VRGSDGEQWPVPADQFGQRYAKVDRDPDVRSDEGER
jgi:hypothetical protein